MRVGFVAHGVEFMIQCAVKIPNYNFVLVGCLVVECVYIRGGQKVMISKHLRVEHFPHYR